MSAKENDLTTREVIVNANRRLVGATIASAAATLAMAVAITVMMPLKESVPFIVEVNKETGEARIPPQVEAYRYTPTEEVKRFFVKRWIVDAFTINQYTMVKENDPRARAMLRGRNALAAYDEQMARDQKFQLLARNPAMTRDVTVESITPVAGTSNAMVANIVLHTRIDGSVSVINRMITIYFDFFNLRDRREAEVSPIGLFITDFKVSDVQ